MAPLAHEASGAEPNRREGRAPLREVELEALLARRRPRPLRVVALVATLLLALVPLWLSLAGPLEAALDQSRSVRVTANVSAGTVAVDGRAEGDRLPLTLRLAPGRHALSLEAPEFRERGCRLTVPAPAPGDTCTITGVPGSAGDGGLTISFGLSAGDLLPGQVPAVRTALDDGLSARLARMGVDAAPGEWYATGAPNGQAPAVGVRQADEPLRAVPRAALTGLPGAYACSAPLCPELAGQDLGAGTGADVVWRVRMGVTLGWDFATGAGAPVGRVRYQPGIGGPTLVLALAYDARAGWRLLGDAMGGRSLEAQVAEGLCVDGEVALLQEYPDRLLLSSPGVSKLEGCALKIRWAASRHRAELAGEVVCRFGAALAADAATRALFPDLAVASQGERVAAAG